MVKIVSIDPAERSRERNKKDLLDILEVIREQVESGEIVGLVAASLCDDGECQIHVKVSELINGIGLFELGKHMLIQQEAFGE